MGEISVQVTVTDANGKNSNVLVTVPIVVGDLIRERINITAAEAASMADYALNLDDGLIHKDKRKAR